MYAKLWWFTYKQFDNYTLETTEKAIKNGQSKDIDNNNE